MKRKVGKTILTFFLAVSCIFSTVALSGCNGKNNAAITIVDFQDEIIEVA